MTNETQIMGRQVLCLVKHGKWEYALLAARNTLAKDGWVILRRREGKCWHYVNKRRMDKELWWVGSDCEQGYGETGN